MAGKVERVIVEIDSHLDGGHAVGVHYEGVTQEASMRDVQAARELALHTLCSQAIEMRLQQGQRIPGVLLALVEAKTFTDFA